MKTVTLADIQEAKNVLSHYLTPTPLLYNTWLSEKYGCEVYLKLENMQPIGSFKIRGATYKISRLSKQEKKKGVIAASAGNHAQGVAWGARKLKTSALIVMPENAPLVKVQNTKSLGAEVVLHGATYDEAFQEAQRIARKTGRIYIHAFEDAEVISGQGTIALEVLDQLENPDLIIGALGGGGLMTGISTVIKALQPSIKLYGAQAKGAPALTEAIHAGKMIQSDSISTFADGIAIKKSSEPIRKILTKNLDELFLCDDEEIAQAVLTLAEKAKVVAEGAGAIPLAVLDRIYKKLKGKKVVLLICGGNLDVNVLGRIIDHGLMRLGRRLRVKVLISDRTGSLSRLTQFLAAQGANVIQAIHDRDEPSARLDQTEVVLNLETRGMEHTRAILKAFRENKEHYELLD